MEWKRRSRWRVCFPGDGYVLGVVELTIFTGLSDKEIEETVTSLVKNDV